MRTQRHVIALTAAVTISCLFWGIRPAFGDEPQRDVAAALTELTTWLNAGPNAKGWSAYLNLPALESEVAKGNGADLAVVESVLKQLDSKAPGLELRQFRKLHDALSLWTTDLVVAKAPNLSDAVLGFESKFQPIPAADVAKSKAALEVAVAKLDKFLQASGANGTAWKTYLEWPKMTEQLQSTTPDPKALRALEAHFTADFVGLETPVFADVGVDLGQYADVLDSQNEVFKAKFTDELKGLAEEFKRYADSPTQELGNAIGARLGWLQSMGQVNSLVQLLRAKYSKPNILTAISGRLVSAGINQPVDDNGPIRDVILGTDISGSAHTVGNLYGQLVPDENRAVVEVTLIGTTQTRTVGYNGPATIHSNGTTQIRGAKRIAIDEYGVSSFPATAQATTKTQITGVSAGGNMAQRVATNRVYESKSQAEQIAGQHAGARARQRVDEQAKTQVSKAQADYLQKFRNPLLRKREFPELLKFSTTHESLFVTMLQADRQQLGAPHDPPEIAVTSDLAIRTHESGINHLANAMLAGVTLKQEDVEAQVIDIRGSLPEQLKSDESRGPWAITLADADPVSVVFPENGMQITIRGRRYKSGNDTFRAMNVTAEYKIEKNGDQYIFRRQGELRIVPPDFEPGKSLSSRQITLSVLLKKKFGKIFEPEIKSEGLILPGKWKAAGRLDLKQMESKGGWLAMAWLESGEPAPSDKDGDSGNKVAHEKQ